MVIVSGTEASPIRLAFFLKLRRSNSLTPPFFQVQWRAMVELVFREKKFQVKENIAARDALKKVGIDPESVLVVVNGKLTTDDVILKEGDKVKLVAVVSGGK